MSNDMTNSCFSSHHLRSSNTAGGLGTAVMALSVTLALVVSFGLSLTASVLTASAQNPASMHVQNLEASPRHHEWVDIPVPPVFSDDPQDRSIKTFIAYPERSDASLVVMVIHENRGLTDWVRSMADQIAAAGYLAVAPDLLSDFSEEYGETRDFPDQDAARTALYQLNPDQIMKDMAAVWNHVAVNISNTGQLAVAGFCWGGTQAFRYVAFSSGVQAAFVFYGSSPTEPSDYQWIADSGTEVYGFYAENDERINSQLAETERMAAEAGMTFEPVIYAGSGHAFMRLGEEAGAAGGAMGAGGGAVSGGSIAEANAKARTAAWERLVSLLEKTESEIPEW